MARQSSRDSAEVDWSDFLASWEWKQGEHVTLLGPTGSGKTTLANAILEKRGWVVIFAVKRRDETLRRLRGFDVVREWPPRSLQSRVILWPVIDQARDIARQADVFREAFDDIYRRGSWTVVLDEVRYVTESLRLARWVELLWQQGRSMGVSVVAGTQRPARIPLAAYDQATHLFLWRDQDRRNLKRLSEIGGDSDRIAREVSGLKPHEVLYVNARTGSLARTRVN